MKRVPSRVAVLAALDEGIQTIAEIAERAGMTSRAVTQTLGRLKGKSPPRVRRTNKTGFATIARFAITTSGRDDLSRAKKQIGLE